MDDNIQTAVLFTANYIEEKNLIFLVPQRIIIGTSNEDATCFEDIMSTNMYKNIDEEVRNNNSFGFYYVKTIGELKKIYNVDEVSELMDIYLADLYTKMYYYDTFDDKDFNTYFLKECSIEEFDRKFNLNVNYKQDEEQIEIEPSTQSLKDIKSTLDSNILYQDDAKNQLLLTLYNNSISDNEKSNIIICGPSGVGKTAMLKELCKGNNLAIYSKFECMDDMDANYYLNSLLRQLYLESRKRNVGLENSIIIIDDADTYYPEECDFYYSLGELGEELNCLFNEKNALVKLDEAERGGIVMDVSQITFIICGNFDKVSHVINVPNDFFKYKNYKLDNKGVPDVLDFSKYYNLSIDFMKHFNTIISFDELDLDKLKHIITDSSISPLITYCNQLSKQGITDIHITDSLINLICKKAYSKEKNAKDLEKVVKKMFNKIVVESLEYIGTEAELKIEDEIFDKYKKGYQFTLKNGSKK